VISIALSCHMLCIDAGEYAALASVVELLSVPGLVSLVFLRGMVMQGAPCKECVRGVAIQRYT
jgi:hypothetical protein